MTYSNLTLAALSDGSGSCTVGKTFRAQARMADKSSRQNHDAAGEPAGRDDSAAFTIVALRGSTGSLSALKAFFTDLPDDIGMAFVLVTQLQPDHQSVLPEIIARHTSTPGQKTLDHVMQGYPGCMHTA